jgi:Protein of unknown function (DUF3987)
VRALAPATDADPVALLVQTRLLFGSVVGRGPHFTVGGDKHFTNEFAALVGPTAAGRKGTSAGRVQLAFADLNADWLTRRNLGGTSSGEGLLWVVRDPIRKRERTNRGRGCPPTYEEVESDPGEPDKRAVVYEPEFAGVLKQTERQGNTASVVLRQRWDGREVTQTLTKNNPAKATGAHVSPIGHITAEELHRYLTATETANGFGNRFLFACVKRSKLLPDGGRVAESAIVPLRERLAAAVAFTRTVGVVPRHPSADGCGTPCTCCSPASGPDCPGGAVRPRRPACLAAGPAVRPVGSLAQHPPGPPVGGPGSVGLLDRFYKLASLR